MHGLFKRLNMSSHNLPNRLKNFLVPNWTRSMDWVVSSSQEQIFRNQVYAPYLPWQMGNYAGNYMKIHHDERRLEQNPSNVVWTTWTSNQVSELFEKRVKLAVKLLLKKHAKSEVVPKQETIWYFVDTFCKILHDLACYPFKPIRKKLYHYHTMIRKIVKLGVFFLTLWLYGR